MTAPDPQLRPKIQSFYNAIRTNDIAALQTLQEQGCPVLWVQAFSETSLPEYAMRHGSVEAAWWLMAQGVMPEKWTAFSGSAWKTFVKKGLNLAITRQGPSIPLEMYKNIVKMAIKTTGENFPTWWEGAWTTSSNNASQIANTLLDKLNNKLGQWSQARPSPDSAPSAKPKSSRAPKPTVSSASPAPPRTAKRSSPTSSKSVKTPVRKKAGPR